MSEPLSLPRFGLLQLIVRSGGSQNVLGEAGTLRDWRRDKTVWMWRQLNKKRRRRESGRPPRLCSGSHRDALWLANAKRTAFQWPHKTSSLASAARAKSDKEVIMSLVRLRLTEFVTWFLSAVDVTKKNRKKIDNVIRRIVQPYRTRHQHHVWEGSLWDRSSRFDRMAFSL